MKRFIIQFIGSFASLLFLHAQGVYVTQKNGTKQLIQVSEVDSIINENVSGRLDFVKNGKTILSVSKDDLERLSFKDKTEKKTFIEAIDLGLPSGTKWASQNLGAINRTDLGYLFAWGEIGAKQSYLQDNYKFYKDGRIEGYTAPYLLAEDDAATSAIGEEWHMPSFQQMMELMNCCSIEEIEYYSNIKSSQKNMLYKMTGPNGNSIYMHKSIYYWMSNSCNVNEAYAFQVLPKKLTLNAAYLYPDTIVCQKNRFCGYLIRPVKGNYVMADNFVLDAEDILLPTFSTNIGKIETIAIEDNLKNQKVEGMVHNNSYQKISPTSNSSKITATFDFSKLNVMGGKYDIYVVMVPENIMDSQNTNPKFSVFTSSLAPHVRMDSPSKVTYTNPVNVGTSTNYLKNDVSKVDTVLLYEDIVFSENQIVNPMLRIQSVFKTSLTKTATPYLNIDCFILKRKN